ncbi:MAG: DUF3365 domain-containing protein [Campylobacterota bacterium]
MHILKSIILFTLSTNLVFGASQSKKDSELEKVIKTGERGSKLLIQTLGKKMKSKLKKDGVMKTLDFCADEAYNITQKVNKKLPKGVRVKRISAKYRNPANSPKDNELAVLESFAKLKSSNVIMPKQLVEQVDENTFKYYKPLFIEDKACLECHGVIKDVEVRRAITARYPIDSANNYELGDFRGAVVVTIVKSAK